MPSRGKKVSIFKSVQHEHRKPFWSHIIPGSNKIKLQHPSRVLKAVHLFISRLCTRLDVAVLHSAIVDMDIGHSQYYYC